VGLELRLAAEPADILISHGGLLKLGHARIMRQDR
jgi:hypothetical protein